MITLKRVATKKAKLLQDRAMWKQRPWRKENRTARFCSQLHLIMQLVSLSLMCACDLLWWHSLKGVSEFESADNLSYCLLSQSDTDHKQHAQFNQFKLTFLFRCSLQSSCRNLNPWHWRCCCQGCAWQMVCTCKGCEGESRGFISSYAGGTTCQEKLQRWRRISCHRTQELLNQSS